MKTMLKNFRDPGPDFRGAPFWAWNAGLDREEMIRQIRVFKKMGFGGFFMHSRVGLNTPYLSREWFDCIRTCVEEAKKLGMKANLYDEDRWPSGAAGSLVTRDDRYKERYCSFEIYTTPAAAAKADKGKALAWFSAEVTGSEKTRDLEVKSPRRLAGPEQFKRGAGRKLLRFAEYFMEKDSWYNGETYLDTLNPEAVEKFVEVTHEAYWREFGAEFGRAIPMIFTDEPNFRAPEVKTVYYFPWTDRLPELFRAEYQLDVLDFLPEIFFPSVRKVSAVRGMFFNLVTKLFCRAFSDTIGRWCSGHHIRMTGHVLLEDQLEQALHVGAAMRFYESMQMPGIDLLTEHWRVFNTAKQCTSMAHQFGRKWRLSETYGCTGWDFPFAGHKALGDWQYALGINFRCQHLAWYSAEAEAKRDYPASISYQSSWHEKYSALEDYFGRLGAVLTEGEELCELLVIHPIESAWMRLDPADPAGSLKGMEKRFAALTDHLLAQKLDFDFGDEEILSRYGKVRNGRIAVNKASYKAVLVPRLLTIRSTTLKLLRSFAEKGGLVVYLDSAPAYLDGRRSRVPGEVFARFRKATQAQAVPLLEKVVRRVSVTDPAGRQIGPVLARLKDAGRYFSLFLCNYGTEFRAGIMEECLVRDRKRKFPAAAVELTLPRRGEVYELNPSDGTVCKVKSLYRNGKYRFRTAFEQLESHLFLITEEDPGRTVRRTLPAAGRVCRRLSGSWDYELDEPNVLVLDHADWSVNAKCMGKNEFILKADDRLRALLGKPPRGGAMVQPWLREQIRAKKQLDLTLTYHINIGELPASETLLALEHPEFYRIELNGKKLKQEIRGWWCDRVLQCVAIPGDLLKKGGNQLVLRSRYHENLPGLEAMFLLGAFGVNGDTVTALPETLHPGDWGRQGLRYYAGNVIYSRTVEVPGSGAVLDLGEWRGVLLGIRIDGGEEKLLPWPPYRTIVPAGKHRLAVTVYGSRRNAMGPFYDSTPWPVWTGPENFKKQISEERQLVPCGLLSAPVLKTVLPE